MRSLSDGTATASGHHHFEHIRLCTVFGVQTTVRDDQERSQRFEIALLWRKALEHPLRTLPGRVQFQSAIQEIK